MGVIEAKPEGTTLSGVAEQTDGYITSIPPNLPHVREPLPFSYETTGVETYFRDIRDPDTRSRRVFAFHQPETLKSWILVPDTLRVRLVGMADINELQPEGLRLCQFEAIHNLEQSFARAKPKALIQMATGTGKTYTAVSFIYRLIKITNAKRVLFLVNKSNLWQQTKKEFQQFITPERRLSVADEIEKTIEQSLKRAECLRQSILKRAFEGSWCHMTQMMGRQGCYLSE